jgi:soluble lytic murein transglycosylase
VDPAAAIDRQWARRTQARRGAVAVLPAAASNLQTAGGNGWTTGSSAVNQPPGRKTAWAAQQPERRLLRALARHLRRGPAAQRLAAGTGPPPRLGQLRAEYPRFRMNDDREVTCYALLTQHLAGQDVRRGAGRLVRAARPGRRLRAAGQHPGRGASSSARRHLARIRLSVENNRPRAARAAARCWARPPKRRGRVLDNPPALPGAPGRGVPAATQRELALLALMRLAANDPERPPAAGPAGPSAWRTPGRHGLGACRPPGRLQAVAAGGATRARPGRRSGTGRPRPRSPPWSDELLAWHVRAACANPPATANAGRWCARRRHEPTEQRDPAWVYWRPAPTWPRATRRRRRGTRRRGAGGPARDLAPHNHFYGHLAAEELGGRQPAAAPPPLTPAELTAPRQSPGFARACSSSSWACATKACASGTSRCAAWATASCWPPPNWPANAEVWDRCINTSERTAGQIDMRAALSGALRDQVLAQARAAGLDPASCSA